MTIDVSDATAARIRDYVDRGRYESADAVVRAALRTLDDGEAETEFGDVQPLDLSPEDQRFVADVLSKPSTATEALDRGAERHAQMIESR